MKNQYKVVLRLFSIGILFFAKSANASDKKNYPILILGVPGRFNTYTGEILKAEGSFSWRRRITAR